jgi:hypothetical protein
MSVPDRVVVDTNVLSYFLRGELIGADIASEGIWTRSLPTTCSACEFGYRENLGSHSCRTRARRPAAFP